MIRKLLCFFNIHKYEYGSIVARLSFLSTKTRTCKHCKRYERLVGISGYQFWSKD